MTRYLARKNRQHIMSCSSRWPNSSHSYPPRKHTHIWQNTTHIANPIPRTCWTHSFPSRMRGYLDPNLVAQTVDPQDCTDAHWSALCPLMKGFGIRNMPRRSENEQNSISWPMEGVHLLSRTVYQWRVIVGLHRCSNTFAHVSNELRTKSKG